MNLFVSIAKSFFHSLGLQVSRLPSESRESQELIRKQGFFYNPPENCQISELANLYSIYLGERHEGFFVEVGAFDGISFSNSSCLADRGWEGLLIEPIPEFAEMVRKLYLGNRSIEIIESAVGATNATTDIFLAGALTTTQPQILDSYRDIWWAKDAVADTTSITVPMRRLESHGNGRPIDVLIVDVEGEEESVFKGFTLSRWRPRLLIVELAHTHPDLYSVSQGHKHLQCRIEQEGYTVIYKDLCNTVFCVRDGIPK